MALPVFTLPQITGQLQRQWGGTFEGTTRTWTDGSLEYSMPDQAPNNNGANEANGFVVMTAAQKAFAREAFELWDDLIQTDLTETTSRDAQITLAYSSTTTGGGTYTSAFTKGLPPPSSVFDNEIVRERAWMSTSWVELRNANMVYGERGMETFIHEIGHALGLSHPGSYNAGDGSTYATGAEYAQDTLQYTTMSYWNAGADGTVIDRTGTNATTDVNNDGINASTPLLHDIAAIQAKYGASTNTRVGDTVYGFHSTANRGAFDFNLNPNPVIAIWDSSGNDTLDCTGFTQNQIIDLNPGAFSSVGALTLNVAIAFNCFIEKAQGGSGNDTITGNSADNFLAGNGGNDMLLGMDGADLLQGFAGNDTLNGGFGFIDTLLGGTGNDTYIVSDNDIIEENFNEGFDQVQSSVRWVLGANLEQLSLTGNANVNGFGNTLDNLIFGNDGSNYLDGGLGADSLFGGKGDDRYALGDTFVVNGANTWDSVREFAGGGIDTVYASADVGRYTYQLEAFCENLVATGLGVMRLWGNELANTLTGNANANTLEGFVGNDTLIGGLGGDFLLGGIGNDAYYLDDTNIASAFSFYRYDTVTELAGQGIDWVFVNSDAFTSTITSFYALGANVENARVTGVSRFFLTGNELDNSLNGNNAVNTLTGLAGNDRLEGGLGEDSLVGGLGNDSYVLGDTNSSQLFTFIHYDSVTEDVNGGIDTVYVDSNQFTSTITSFYTLGANVENGITTGTSNFILTGNELNNSLIGNSAVNTLTGLAGNDRLDGGLAEDTLKGGLGNDTYILGDTNSSQLFAFFHYDSVIEDVNGGIDTVHVDSNQFTSTITSFYTLGANVENGITTGTSNFILTGNELNNSLIGNSAVNTLTGLAGNDRLEGGLAEDTLKGGLGNDTYVLNDTNSSPVIAALHYDTVVEDVNGGNDTVLVNSAAPSSAVAPSYTLGANIENGTITGAANFSLTGNSFGNVMNGNSAANTLKGLNGNDIIKGGLGTDKLIGGVGADHLYGEGGNDQFIFSALTDSGVSVGLRDVIHDFTLGDKISLSAIDANSIAAMDQAFRLDTNGSFSIGEIGLQISGADLIVRLNTDADAAAEMEFLVLNRTNLNELDFLL